MEQSIENDAGCFCCGTQNERGLHLRFSYPASGEAEASLIVPEYFSGWKNMTHGGFLSMLLDEAMAHACIHVADSPVDRAAVTAEMTVRFRKPVETGTRVRIVGTVVETRGRILSTHGTVFDESGAAAAEATAKFLLGSQG